jgi:hypothetical protein
MSSTFALDDAEMRQISSLATGQTARPGPANFQRAMSAPTGGLPRRPLGGTGLGVTPICVGGGPLGSMPENFGYGRLRRTWHRDRQSGPRWTINFLDTAAGYSDGESERRVGAALAAAGGLPRGIRAGRPR